MTPWISIIIVLGCFIAGLVAGRYVPPRYSGRLSLFVDLSLYLLLFFMGFRLGRNSEVQNQLSRIGAQALIFTLLPIAGTAAVQFLYLFFRKKRVPVHAGHDIRTGERAEPVTGTATFLSHLKEPGKLLMIVIAGFLAGRFIPLLPLFTAENVTTIFVYILLFFIGIQLQGNAVSLKTLFLSRETFLLPLMTIIGTAIGGAAAALICAIPLNKGVAVTAGFGWYSLSGVIIANAGDQVLGSVSFLSNILRESAALLVIPLLGRTKWAKIGIAVAGATSMDVCLPLVGKSLGSHAVPLSVSHGVILSCLVPILVPLLFQIG